MKKTSKEKLKALILGSILKLMKLWNLLSEFNKIQCLLSLVSNHYLPIFSKTASCLVSCRTCNFNGGKMSNWSFVALTYNLLVRSHELQEMDQLSFGTWEVNLVKEVVPA